MPPKRVASDDIKVKESPEVAHGMKMLDGSNLAKEDKAEAIYNFTG